MCYVDGKYNNKIMQVLSIIMEMASFISLRCTVATLVCAKDVKGTHKLQRNF